MDRNKKWARTKIAWECIANGKAKESFVDAEKKLLASYKKGETDEFVKPKKKEGYEGIKKGDGVIFFNFRTDRLRQLVQAMVEPRFPAWKRKPLKSLFVAMTEYYGGMKALPAFKHFKPKNILSEILSRRGIKQLRISETEKYPHVTFFFDGQNEKSEKGVKKIIVPSPKVATYDLKPEMSAFELTRTLVKEIKTGKFGLVVVNIVNGDMVGHTGIRKACLKAAETVDLCLEKIVKAGLSKDYVLIVFADHGNLENQSPGWTTSHTKNKVPLILVSKEESLKKGRLRKGAGLQDIAPTVLELMGIAKPVEMTGKSLLKAK